MLFPAVTELLGHLARLPALDEAFEALRQGSRTEEVAGLTQPAKALVAALAATELRTPTLVLVEDERKAASLLEALDFFYRTVNGRSAAPALLLPALDTLPGLGAGPHPEILEARAWTLSRFVSGQCSVVVAPIEATLLRFAPPQFYESLSLALAARRRDFPGRGCWAPDENRIHPDRISRDGRAVQRARRNSRRVSGGRDQARAHRAAGRHGGVAARIRSRDAALDGAGKPGDPAAAHGVSIRRRRGRRRA